MIEDPRWLVTSAPARLVGRNGSTDYPPPAKGERGWPPWLAVAVAIAPATVAARQAHRRPGMAAAITGGAAAPGAHLQFGTAGQRATLPGDGSSRWR
jgi:hypothetical protein